MGIQMHGVAGVPGNRPREGSPTLLPPGAERVVCPSRRRGRRTAGSCGTPVAVGAAARRNPSLWFRLSGSFLLREADRQFLPGLFQLPPRSTRAEALAVPR